MKPRRLHSATTSSRATSGVRPVSDSVAIRAANIGAAVALARLGDQVEAGGVALGVLHLHGEVELVSPDIPPPLEGAVGEGSLEQGRSRVGQAHAPAVMRDLPAGQRTRVILDGCAL